MPEITPIPNREWILRKAGKQLRYMFPGQRLCTHCLPVYNVTPDILCRSPVHSVEFMVALLRAGAWIQSDWQVYVRYTIAKRLRIRAAELWVEPFHTIQEEALEFQLNGGTFKTRNQLRRFAANVFSHPLSSPTQQVLSRLVLSFTDEIAENTLIQPFHWIRVGLGLSDPNPNFSLALVHAEMYRQKITLAQFLAAECPNG